MTFDHRLSWKKTDEEEEKITIITVLLRKERNLFFVYWNGSINIGCC